METKTCSSWDMEAEYEKLIRRLNPPRVVIDNESCGDATVIQVDSANKQGILLEVVQILTDLNLMISKAYISSDGGWFMDVFNVTDKDGKKLRDESTVKAVAQYIRESLASESGYLPAKMKSVGVAASREYTSIELTGMDRPGLLSELSAVLSSLNCNVLDAEVWTHNTRAAAVVHVTDEATGTAITDPDRLTQIKDRLRNVLNGSTNTSRTARTAVSQCGTHTERRLHQMMFDDRDYERLSEDGLGQKLRPSVTVVNCQDKDYSVVTIRCKDRRKLLFDTVCTLTDMQYIIFHANVDVEPPEAYQEFYIQHVDGSPINSEAERERIMQCLEAAIQRRVSEDLKLELCTGDRVGLLSDVTRIFRENSLTVTRAEVTTRGDKAVNTFYVRDAGGAAVDPKTIDAVRQAIGLTVLKVKGHPEHAKALDDSSSSSVASPAWFLFGSLFKSMSLGNLSLLRPYSH